MSSYLKSGLFRFYIFSLLRDFSFFSAVLIPFYTDWAGMTLIHVTILQSWFGFWILIMEVPTGAIADYFGRKYSLILGSVAVAIAVLVYGSAPRFEVFLIAEFIFAISFALVSGADKALLYDTLVEQGREKDSIKIFGRVHAINLLGILAAAPIGSFIAYKIGLNAPMLLTAIPMFLAALVAFTIKEPRRYQDISESRRYLQIAKEGFSYFYKHKALRRLVLDAVVVASAAYFVIWLYQPILRTVNIPIYYFGFFHAAILGAQIVVAGNFERFEKLFGSSKNFLRFSAVVTSICFLTVAIYPNLITVTLFIILAGGFGLTRLELMSSYMNKFIPSNQRATVLSSISMLRRFALVILNPLVGFSADHSLRLTVFAIGLLPLLIFLFSPIKQDMLEN